MRFLWRLRSGLGLPATPSRCLRLDICCHPTRDGKSLGSRLDSLGSSFRVSHLFELQLRVDSDVADLTVEGAFLSVGVT